MGVTLEQIKQYLNIPIEYIEDDQMLNDLKLMAEAYILEYTGQETISKSLELVELQLVSSNYNQRDYLNTEKLDVSPFALSILNMNSVNLV